MSWIATYSPGFAFYGQPYEAGTLVQDVRHFAAMVAGAKPEPFEYEAVTDVAQLDWLLKEPWFSVDIETAAEHPDRSWTGKDPTRALMKMIGFGATKRCCSILWATATPAIKRRVEFLLASSAFLKVLQNGPWFDNRVLRRYGMKIRRYVDTRDMRRAQSSTSRLGLGYLGSIYTLTDNWKAKDAAEDDEGKVVFTKDLEKLGRYNGQDCIITSRVVEGLWKESWGAREQRLYEVHRDLSIICAEMHTTGIHVNHQGRDFMRFLLRQSIAEKAQILKDMVNIGGWYPSPDNMRAIIYRRHERKVRLTDDTFERTTRKGRAHDAWFRKFSLGDPGNPRMYADDEMETISVDEPSLLLLLVSGDCPPELVPIIDAWWNYQQDTKRLGYLDSYLVDQAIGVDNRLRPGWNSCGTDTMRMSCSEPNVQNIEQILRELFAPAPGNVIIHADKCVTPETKVLKADLTWVPAGELKVGDELVGFDEHLRGSCRMRGSFVESLGRITKPCVTVQTDRGAVTCSSDHMWAARAKGKLKFVWIAARDLCPGDEVKYFVEPWEMDTSYEGGYLAGIYDGEGCLSRTGVSFTQNEGPVFDRVEALVRARGFETYSRHGLTNSKKAKQLHVTGQRAGLRLLGMIRPSRLMAKSRQAWEGTRPHGKLTRPAVVQAVLSAGSREVVAMGTSTKTFVANGFMSHNCQLEIRVMEAVANDRALKQAIDEGDVYSFDARRWFRLPADFNVKKLKPAARKAAKIIHLGRQYRAGLGAVYAQALLQDRTFTFERTRLLCKEFDETYSDTVHYWNAEMAQVHERGFSEGCILFGRRSYPAPPEPSEVANYPIQRTAAEMMNLEIIALWKRLKKEVPTARIMGQYHDAIEVECAEKLEQKVTRIIEDVMNREWTIRGRTRAFPVEIKTCRSSEGGTVADV